MGSCHTGPYSGGNIVLSAAVSDVAVTTTGPVETDLGTRPEGTVRFPRGFDGMWRLSITTTGKNYDDPWPGALNKDAPPRVSTLRARSLSQAGPRRALSLLACSGNALVSVTWDYKNVGGGGT